MVCISSGNESKGPGEDNEGIQTISLFYIANSIAHRDGGVGASVRHQVHAVSHEVVGDVFQPRSHVGGARQWHLATQDTHTNIPHTTAAEVSDARLGQNKQTPRHTLHLARCRLMRDWDQRVGKVSLCTKGSQSIPKQVPIPTNKRWRRSSLCGVCLCMHSWVFTQWGCTARARAGRPIA